MIVCHCAAVTDATILRLIAEGATSAKEIARRCGAGRRCAPCRDEVDALLYASRQPEHVDWLETQLELLKQVGGENYLAQQMRK